VALLRELLAEKGKQIAHLERERDEWREQCKKQLLLLAAPKEAPKKKRWWQRNGG
jgi:hypothetical protein